MARVTWSTFDRLTAAQVQTVSDQGVMRFATTTARDAALGVGVREVGMMSAVAAAPDNGAPRYWDGSAWTLVSAGVLVPNVLASGDSVNMGQLLPAGTVSSGVWFEVSAGLADPAVIYGVQVSNLGNARVDVGTGASGAEVVRYSGQSIGGSGGKSLLIPYGVYVPASKRIAVRCSAAVGTPSLRYYTTTGGTEVQAGFVSVAFAANTSWQQVAATPPLAGGVEVVGFGDTGGRKMRLGLGAASSEVDMTGYVLDQTRGPGDIPPFTWSAGTRLALQFETAPAFGGNLDIFWRESLA